MRVRFAIFISIVILDILYNFLSKQYLKFLVSFCGKKSINCHSFDVVKMFFEDMLLLYLEVKVKFVLAKQIEKINMFCLEQIIFNSQNEWKKALVTTCGGGGE